MLTESVDYEQFMNYNFLINSSIDSNKHYAQTDIVWKEPIYKIWLMEKNSVCQIKLLLVLVLILPMRYVLFFY